MPHHTSDLAGSGSSDRRWFSTTHWSVVLLIQEENSTRASQALEKLCRSYWRPLYSYVRRHGHSPEDAEDLTQAFFAKLLEKNFWERADPVKGRFRCLLLTALRHFLADQRDRAKTAKRGGGIPLISFDDQTVEEQFREGLAATATGEQQFDRQWATTVLEQARHRLHQECVEAGKSALYDGANLLGDSPDRSMTYADLASQLGMSVSAIKTAVARLRVRYGELVREEVERTVSTPAEVDEELGYLLSVIGS